MPFWLSPCNLRVIFDGSEADRNDCASHPVAAGKSSLWNELRAAERRLQNAWRALRCALDKQKDQPD
jgi:hypothetical protein